MADLRDRLRQRPAVPSASPSRRGPGVPRVPGTVGYRLAQLGAAGAALGGAVDVAVPRLLPHHEAALGVAAGQAPPATAALVLLLLHVLGVALVAVGLAALALLAAWRRAGLRWAGAAAAGVVVVVEGVNAWAIARVRSPLFAGPLLCALLVAGGVLLGRRAGARAPGGG
jgi:hypothetical protein